MSIVELKNLAKGYGKKTVLRDINLTVEPGDFMVVFGLPVSGKSVLVRLLAGLEKPDAGRVIIRGKDMTHAAPGDRNLGYVPQSFALYPHFSVYDNIAYSLNLAHVPKSEVKVAVERAASLLKIEQFLNRKPDQLSGGQKQRVAIARGLVKKTELFLLDDPLVGLDFKLRERLIDDLKQTQDQLKVTFVYTTSEAIEAMQLAKNIAVMDAGEIVEVGAPETLYAKPARAQTMRYVGFPQANFLRGSLAQKDGGTYLHTPLFEAAVDQSIPTAPAAINGDVTVGIRPEHIVIGNPPTGTLHFQAKVLLREDLGGEEIIYLDANGQQLTTVLRSDDANTQHIDLDQTITAYLHPRDAVVFVDGKYLGRAIKR
jgi:ABC-type sugar transport system ATPase subunit